MLACQPTANCGTTDEAPAITLKIEQGRCADAHAMLVSTRDSSAAACCSGKEALRPTTMVVGKTLTDNSGGAGACAAVDTVATLSSDDALVVGWSMHSAPSFVFSWSPKFYSYKLQSTIFSTASTNGG